MDNGWEASADAWIEEMGQDGDFSRRYVLDPVMLSLALAGSPRRILDVGCGEGRFCRMVRRRGVDVVGIDPTAALIATARARDAKGTYLKGVAESLPFGDATFDTVISYLSLIDIPDMHRAILEMTRVLKPGGTVLIANLNSFVTACGDRGWVKDSRGTRQHYPVDDYMESRAMWIAYRDIRFLNHHRPLSAYMSALLDAGLTLTYFDEPEPTSETSPSRASSYRRVPWFLVMEWVKPTRGRVIPERRG